MAFVDVGALNHIVDLVYRTRTVDANGHYSVEERSVKVHARVEVVNAIDAVRDGAERAIETLRFIIRWRSDVTVDCVMRYRGRDYEIDSVDPVPFANHMMRIRAVSYDEGA